MKLSTTAKVDAPPERVFDLVSDVERVAPCLPGTKITGRDGDDYLGSMSVKVGPIAVKYHGRIRFLELDAGARRAVMSARADDASGQGSAEATIVTTVEADGDGSVLTMETDLRVRGRVARFGRGALEKVSERMFEQLARGVEEQLAGGADAAKTPADAEAAPPPTEDRPADLDVMALLPGERVRAVAGAAVVAFVIGYLMGTVRALRAMRS
jgi:carbon monoxide dehydrogenase subunit G